MMLGVLDRYLLREWFKIFVITVTGFPIIVTLFELTDELDVHLARGLTSEPVALAYVFGLPEKVFLVLPAAVLFATVFTLGSMARHSEIVATKAAGRSFHRLLVPLLFGALCATGIGLIVGEMAPPATRRQEELLGSLKHYTQRRTNFVYRAEEGWVYTIRELNAGERRARDLVLERQGTGQQYPTLSIQAEQARYDDDAASWTLTDGRFRVLSGGPAVASFIFDSMHVGAFSETPDGLLVQEKRPEEMRYSELGRYIDSLERSGGDGRKLRVGQALKIAVPFTCLVIALFGAPMAIASPKASGAVGVAISLGTTIVFLTLVQLSRAIGGGGLVPPTAAAWLPNAVFGIAGLILLKNART